MKTVSTIALGLSVVFLACGTRPLDASSSDLGGGGSTPDGTGNGNRGTGSGGNGGTTGTTTGGSNGGGKGGSMSNGRGGSGGVAVCCDPARGILGCCPQVTGGASGTASPAPYPGFIIYMKFDEGAGATVKDGSIYHNHGTVMVGAQEPALVDPAPNRTVGRSGTAATDRSLELNGVDEWVRIPRSDSIDNIGINNAITISIWVYVKAITLLKPYNVIVQRHILGVRGEHFMLGMLNGVPYAGQNHMGTTGPSDMPLARWVHMAMTFDGLTLTLYVDGEMASFLDTGVPIGPDDTPLSLGAGIQHTDVLEWSNARLDEFHLYDRALNPIEVGHLAGR